MGYIITPQLKREGFKENWTQIKRGGRALLLDGRLRSGGVTRKNPGSVV